MNCIIMNVLCDPPKYGEICIVLDKNGNVYEDDGHFSTEVGEWKLVNENDLIYRNEAKNMLETQSRICETDNIPFDIKQVEFVLSRVPQVF